jgi:RNA recognition motif-containing protein
MHHQLRRWTRIERWHASHPKRQKEELMKKIFVGNLSFSTTEAELRQWFEPYGAVESATVVTDRDTGRSRGFGFVEMSNNTEADTAITALNGSDSGGRALTVNEARPKTDRGGGFRGGRGGGGGGRDDYRGHARQPREPRW